MRSVRFPLKKGFAVEPIKTGHWWTYRSSRSSGELPQTPINELLRWIIDQIILGHVMPDLDEDGDVVSLLIGRDAPYKARSADDAAQEAGERTLAIDLAGTWPATGCRGGVNGSWCKRQATRASTAWPFNEKHASGKTIRAIAPETRLVSGHRFSFGYTGPWYLPTSDLTPRAGRELKTNIRSLWLETQIAPTFRQSPSSSFSSSESICASELGQ